MLLFLVYICFVLCYVENNPIIHSIRHPYRELGLSSSSRRLPQSTLSPSTTADNCTALLSEGSRRRPAQTVPAICSVDFPPSRSAWTQQPLFAPPQTPSNDCPDSRRPEPWSAAHRPTCRPPRSARPNLSNLSRLCNLSPLAVWFQISQKRDFFGLRLMGWQKNKWGREWESAHFWIWGSFTLCWRYIWMKLLKWNLSRLTKPSISSDFFSFLHSCSRNV